MRHGKRKANDMRPVKIQRGFQKYAEGSALIELGSTRVICAATVEERVPPFMRGSGSGWVTAEYGMLPRSSQQRIARESVRGRVGGRTQEIQRLIGRSLRAVTDLPALGETTVVLDCDVIEADGGTRTAAITGAFVALYDALREIKPKKEWKKIPLKDFLAAVSVGIVGGDILLDLAYEEDHRAEVDMNVVMTGRGQLVEVQGTAEGRPFSRAEMDKLLALASKGIKNLVTLQRQCLGVKKIG
jgi:ribonuclease PH